VNVMMLKVKMMTLNMEIGTFFFGHTGISAKN